MNQSDTRVGSGETVVVAGLFLAVTVALSATTFVVNEHGSLWEVAALGPIVVGLVLGLGLTAAHIRRPLGLGLVTGAVGSLVVQVLTLLLLPFLLGGN